MCTSDNFGHCYHTPLRTVGTASGFICRVTLIGKRPALKSGVALKSDGSSSLSLCVIRLSMDNLKRSRRDSLCQSCNPYSWPRTKRGNYPSVTPVLVKEDGWPWTEVDVLLIWWRIGKLLFKGKGHAKTLVTNLHLGVIKNSSFRYGNVMVRIHPLGLLNIPPAGGIIGIIIGVLLKLVKREPC